MKDSYLAQFYGKSQNYTDIPNKWYKEYNVKKGLRNEDGTGVRVGLTRVADVVAMTKLQREASRLFQESFTTEAMM